ncbi:MAG: peptidase M50, partial [Epsilonproteobacteria bacterium]|nr:peptidase M50 [Campylobacterota bacterium]
MQVLTFILNLVLFLVSLGVLITIHELGHFMTAKLFKVYCIEFSIGFGPKFFKRKKKGGETTFSLGAIPLGGYVLMYGEGAELPDGVVIGEERSLEGVKKWKRAIILSAG